MTTTPTPTTPDVAKMDVPSSLTSNNQIADVVKNDIDSLPPEKNQEPEPVKEGDDISNPTSKTDPLVSAAEQIKTGQITKEQVEAAIKSAPNIVIALENVGSLYCVPAQNIVNDNSLSTIKVDCDTISAPELPINSQNSKAVIMAISTVLDHISQRIDQKLDNKQQDAMYQRDYQDDPSFGTVIARDVDEDGNPVTVYDSGNISHARNRAGAMKAAQLRAQMELKYPEPKEPSEPSYFGEDEDIGKDISMENIQSNIPDIPDNTNDPVDQNITDTAEEIQEESFHIDQIARLGDTKYLGYDLFQEMGYDFVKRTEHAHFFNEGFREDHRKPKRRKKEVMASDIKHLKFDNKHLIQAIKHFNAAYKEQSPEKDKDFNIKNFMNSTGFQKGLDSINAQFNCRTIIRFFDFNDESNYRTIGTSMYNDLKTKLTISKSKGFQLGGLPINIMIINSAITDYPSSSKSPEFFGQTFTAVILHEIFHNIALVWKVENGEFKTALAATVNISAALSSTKDKRILFSNFVETISRFKGMKLGKLTKQFMVKRMLALSTVARSEQELKRLEGKMKKSTDQDSSGKANKDTQELINRYKKTAKTLKRQQSTAKTMGLIFAIIFTIPTLGLSLICWIEMTRAIEEYKGMKLFEEYYCDLFAGMYNLPVVFFIESINRRNKYTPNEIDEELLKELHAVDLEIEKICQTTYPSMLERNNASVKIAKQMLASKAKLNPDIKKYLQWIVDNFDSVENLNIDEIYNNTTFDPKEAQDLDKHLQNLINNNQITLTESFFETGKI